MALEEADGAGSGGIRLSDADRDRVAGDLGRHYAAGRLDDDDLNERLEAVYSARYTEQAAATLADLPPLAVQGEKRGRGRRHGEASAPQAGWIPTIERFRDPSTRRLMRVWVDPGDGTRHYIAENAGRPDA